MEQAIQAAVSDKAQKKAFNPMALLKLMGAVNSKDKEKNLLTVDGATEINAIAPFFQLLNQQMALLFQTEKMPAEASIILNGEKISLEQAMLMFQGNADFKELQELAKSGKLKNILAADSDKNNKLASLQDMLQKNISLLQANIAGQENQINADGNSDEITKNIITDLELKAVQVQVKNDASGTAVNQEKEIVAMAKAPTTIEKISTLILDKEVTKIIKLTTPSQISPIENPDVEAGNKSKVIIGEDRITQTDNVGSQNKFKAEIAAIEVQLRGHVQEKTTQVIPNQENIQPQQTIFQDEQKAGIAAGKISTSINAGLVKEGITNVINLPDANRNDNQATNSNVRLSAIEAKDALNNSEKSNLGQQQNRNALDNTNRGGNTSQVVIATLLGEYSDKIKLEQKIKTQAGETKIEEFSFSSISGAGTGSKNIDKANDISPSGIINQIAIEFKENALSDSGRVKIILNPPSLGTLEMDVIVRNNRVEIVLVADNRDVQQTLNKHIDQLKGSLQTQGLTIERCDVLMQDKRDEYQQNFSQHAFYHNGSGEGNNSRHDNREEKFKFNVTDTAEQQNIILKASTDKISLFA